MAPMRKDEYRQKLTSEIRTGPFWRDCFAEMTGSFLLVVAQLMVLQNWHLQDPMLQAQDIRVAVAMCFVVVAVGYALGDFGGSHMNPAVTMAMTLRAEITIVKAIFYWLAQIVAGLLAAFFVYAITPTEQLTDSKLGNTLLASSIVWWQGLLIETTITAILCFTCLASNNIARKGYIILNSVPIGFALGVGLFLALSSTGASMNPSRSLGPCVVGQLMMNMTDCWQHHWIYWVGPLLGSLVAAVFYWMFDGIQRPPSPATYVYNTAYNTAYNPTNVINTDSIVYPSATGYMYQKTM